MKIHLIARLPSWHRASPFAPGVFPAASKGTALMFPVHEDRKSDPTRTIIRKPAALEEKWKKRKGNKEARKEG